MTKKTIPTHFIIDIDGIMTDGRMVYSQYGKEFKLFGPDDNDALQILKKYLKLVFITADKRGFKISKKRINTDMKMDLMLVDGKNRKNILNKKFNLNKSIFMGDGIFDYQVMKSCMYSIAVKDSLDHVKKNADYIVDRTGGNRAVAAASIHILNFFFKISFENLIDE